MDDFPSNDKESVNDSLRNMYQRLKDEFGNNIPPLFIRPPGIITNPIDHSLDLINFANTFGYERSYKSDLSFYIAKRREEITNEQNKGKAFPQLKLKYSDMLLIDSCPEEVEKSQDIDEANYGPKKPKVPPSKLVLGLIQRLNPPAKINISGLFDLSNY